jgi:hypothetical protein
MPRSWPGRELLQLYLGSRELLQLYGKWSTHTCCSIWLELGVTVAHFLASSKKL